MTAALAPGSHVHFVAICGVGMASLAGLLQSQGYRITGSDQNVYPPMSTYLAGLGIELSSGYSEENIRGRPDLVVIGNAVSRNNPEAQAVMERGISYLSLPQALSQFLIGAKRSIVVAGTHGKTTTASLMAWSLSQAGWDPSFFIGGIPVNFQSGFGSGQGEWVVMEGDEYDTAFFDKGPKFLHYKPEKLILTSLEFDHSDIYRDLEHLKESFRRLIELVPGSGILIVSSEYPAINKICQGSRAPVFYYGTPGADWEARNFRILGQRSLFDVFHRGNFDGALGISLMGRHNVTNALAVYAMGRELGIERATLQGALATFAGVRRRQEIKGSVGGITVIDDFAHHPTAVRETVAAVRGAYAGRRLWAIFEPRSHTSRRKIFASEFAQTLAAADLVVVAGLYQPEKVPVQDQLVPEEVVAEINRFSGNGRAVYLQKTPDIVAHVGQEARAGDVILVMSNGGFDGVQDKILQQLRARYS
ncbi:MAG: UDP-N-acetylmuramate:L-alanyl-gamma-D-glutamyl-meso-diaminopimelate ligase [Candidatus Binatia bacterium]